VVIFTVLELVGMLVVCVELLHVLLCSSIATIMLMVMSKVSGLGKFEKQLPLMITLLYFVTGDYLSLIRHLRFFF
jgi:hypothetical protein